MLGKIMDKQLKKLSCHTVDNVERFNEMLNTAGTYIDTLVKCPDLYVNLKAYIHGVMCVKAMYMQNNPAFKNMVFRQMVYRDSQGCHYYHFETTSRDTGFGYAALTFTFKTS